MRYWPWQIGRDSAVQESIQALLRMGILCHGNVNPVGTLAGPNIAEGKQSMPAGLHGKTGTAKPDRQESSNKGTLS